MEKNRCPNCNGWGHLDKGQKKEYTPENDPLKKVVSPEKQRYYDKLTKLKMENPKQYEDDERWFLKMMGDPTPEMKRKLRNMPGGSTKTKCTNCNGYGYT